MKLIPFLVGTILGLGVFVLLKKTNKPLKTQGSSKEVIKYFKSKGLNNYQSIAIAGNLQAESNFRTYASGDSGSAYGIAQWRGSRLRDLTTFANENNLDYRDFYTQLDFIWYELNNKERNALVQLRDSDSLYSATINFAKYYERPQASTYPIRVEYANQINAQLA